MDPRYVGFKEKVLVLAMEKGFRNHLFQPSKTCIVHLGVVALWAKEPLLDWSNIYKAVEDALFSKHEGGDRWVRPSLVHNGFQVDQEDFCPLGSPASFGIDEVLVTITVEHD